LVPLELFVIRPLLLLLFLATLGVAGIARAAGVAFDGTSSPTQLDYRPIGTGVGLLVLPIGMSDSQLPWGHAIELEGFSYAATDIMERVIHEKPWVGPVIIGAADILYRSGEDLSQDLTRRKLACDLLGVVGRVAVDIKF
jgi:hypothetical protein